MSGRQGTGVDCGSKERKDWDARGRLHNVLDSTKPLHRACWKSVKIDPVVGAILP